MSVTKVKEQSGYGSTTQKNVKRSQIYVGHQKYSNNLYYRMEGDNGRMEGGSLIANHAAEQNLQEENNIFDKRDRGTIFREGSKIAAQTLNWVIVLHYPFVAMQ